MEKEKKQKQGDMKIEKWDQDMKNMNDNANSTSLGHFLQSSSVV